MADICPSCGNRFEIGDWWVCPHGRPYGRQGGVVHPKERAVVYRNPATGKVAYPPRNDQPMPDFYASAGYERVELPTLRSVEQFEKAHNVRSEAAWHDSGSGSADHMPESKPIDLTGLSFGVRDGG